MQMQTTLVRADTPHAILRALLRHPRVLPAILAEAGVAPHEIALWARQDGAMDLEKAAGWLAVGQQPGRYKPLLEVAGSHLRAGELTEALAIFRWAYQIWQTTPAYGPQYYADGVKLLTQWGECLLRLDQPHAARRYWLQALNFVRDAETMRRLSRQVERLDAYHAYPFILEHALHRALPGAPELWERWQRVLTAESSAADPRALPLDARNDAPGVGVFADIANLDLVCGEQYGYGYCLDYKRLARSSAAYGPLQVRQAFTPDIPETRFLREFLTAAGFAVNLLRPKRSHGRITANADVALAAHAVRWAGAAQIGRIEIWSGDGDFLCVREVIAEAYPTITIAFRSFENGTASGIRALTEWEPIPHDCVVRRECI
ncbi:MAG: NYN domain-containing protein [Anaerolineae bacterium]|nr:NYN domain-containing protein [Anaerolineae bacterium]